MTLGQELAEITAGVDRLFRADLKKNTLLDQEGLIPVAVAPVTPRDFGGWPAALEMIDAFLARIPGAADTAHDAAWLSEMTLSLASLARMFSGEKQSLRERLRDQLRVDPAPVPEPVLDGYRTELRDALDALGYRSGDLAQDVGAWETETTVRPDDVLPCLTAYQREAQARSHRLVADIGDDWIEPKAVFDCPYSAYCDYPGRSLWLNLEFAYTKADLKHLATHEAFPGHLVHLARREALVARGEMSLDGAQVVTNSASSALFEGIADNGIALLDWIDGPQDIAGLAMQRLRSALQCNATWMAFEGDMTIEQAAQVTAAPSFQSPHKTLRRLACLSHELRAPFLFAYWYGDHAVQQFLQATQDWDRRAVMHELYDKMHTPRTLAAAV